MQGDIAITPQVIEECCDELKRGTEERRITFKLVQLLVELLPVHTTPWIFSDLHGGKLRKEIEKAFDDLISEIGEDKNMFAGSDRKFQHLITCLTKQPHRWFPRECVASEAPIADEEFWINEAFGSLEPWAEEGATILCSEAAYPDSVKKYPKLQSTAVAIEDEKFSDAPTKLVLETRARKQQDKLLEFLSKRSKVVSIYNLHTLQKGGDEYEFQLVRSVLEHWISCAAGGERELLIFTLEGKKKPHKGDEAKRLKDFARKHRPNGFSIVIKI